MTSVMTATVPHRRSRRWIGFFVVLAVLGATAMIVPLVYNLSIQLRPEQLAEARQRWRENGPADYDLAYLVKSEQGGVEAMDRQYFVQVRGGRVVLAVDTGEVVYLDPSLAVVAGPAMLGLSSEDPGRYGVPALFDDIEEALHQRTAGERRDYVRADFDPNDGHPYHYVHHVRGTKERVEWDVKLTRVPAR
jgi:hypothetical protein